MDALGAVGDEQEKATTGIRHSGTAAAAFGTDICRSQPRVLTAVRSRPRLLEKERTSPHRLCATPSRKAGLGVQRKVPFIRCSRTVPLRERHSGAPVESEDLGVSSSGSVSYSISGTEPVRAKT